MASVATKTAPSTDGPWCPRCRSPYYVAGLRSPCRQTSVDLLDYRILIRRPPSRGARSPTCAGGPSPARSSSSLRPGGRDGVTVGALLAEVPHTRPVQVVSSAGDRDLAERAGLPVDNGVLVDQKVRARAPADLKPEVDRRWPVARVPNLAATMTAGCPWSLVSQEVPQHALSIFREFCSGTEAEAFTKVCYCLLVVIQMVIDYCTIVIIGGMLWL
jgi:hypothetical protein